MFTLITCYNSNHLIEKLLFKVCHIDMAEEVRYNNKNRIRVTEVQ